MKKEKKNNVFIIVLLIIVGVLVLFFPSFYNYIETLKLPIIADGNKVDNAKTKKVEEAVLDSLHYPIMRNSIYNSNTYYTLNKFSIKDMSNEDILYNAFLDIYEGNMTSYNGNGKQFNQEYIELRIKNILGKDVKYTLSNFEVPSDSKSNYKGIWTYDAANKKYIYNGVSSNNKGTAYYNLEQYIKANYDNDDIVVYKYVGFAKVDSNNYIIYSDASMKSEVAQGTITDPSELNAKFKSLDKKDKKIYKYIFKDTICSYNEYCLYGGEWVNEL